MVGRKTIIVFRGFPGKLFVLLGPQGAELVAQFIDRVKRVFTFELFDQLLHHALKDLGSRVRKIGLLEWVAGEVE